MQTAIVTGGNGGLGSKFAREIAAASPQWHVIHRLFERGGGHAIFFDHPLQRRFQDIKAMTHHTAMNPDPAARLYSSAQLGLPILDLFLLTRWGTIFVYIVVSYTTLTSR